MSGKAFEKRTFDFGIRCVRLVEALPKSMSARGRSRGDFLSRMGIVEEECDESLYWVDVLIELGFISGKRVEELRKEANSSIKTARKNAKN